MGRDSVCWGGDDIGMPDRFAGWARVLGEAEMVMFGADSP